MNIWHVVLKIDVCFDNPLVFCENIRGRKKTVSYMRITMHVNTMFTVLVKSTMAWTDAIRDVDSCHKATVFYRRPRHCAP